ncbi:PAS domain S-box protein [Geomonas sp. Red32]|uniref:sensor histidine kinase n=1 Tax=Geomonas sp. Red32 TaxID=2912856 RepID=UPI00202CF11B|nr:PAS domain S-box protein [Geomonas sp. Red32]MCM0082930.1 PAS domain S-box protein [Geomonas sp. Red32]
MDNDRKHQPPAKRRDGGGHPSREELVRRVAELEAALTASEEARRCAEEKAAPLFLDAPLPAMVTTLPGHAISEVNEAWCRLFGYRREEAIGRSWPEFALDPEPPAGLSTLARKEGASLASFEQTVATRTGERLLVAIDATLVTLGEGEGALSYLRDITDHRRIEEELKQLNDSIDLTIRERTEGLCAALEALSAEVAERQRAEELLRQSEERYRKVVEDQTETISRFNANGELTFVNEVFCRIFGKTREELLGHSWHPAAYPADVPAIEKGLSTMTPENPVVVIENRIANGAGEIRWMQFVNRGFFDAGGSLVETQSVGRDITERKQAKERLREAMQFSEQVIRSAGEGIVVYDLDLRLRVWNPFMETLCGMKAADVLGSLPESSLPFEDAAQVRSALENALRGEGSAGLDLSYRVPEAGRHGWASLLPSPLVNTRGEVVGVLCTIRDITFRKELENELVQALEQAQEANVAMKRLVNTVAHEFRTPLGLLTGSVDVLDHYWDRLTPEKRGEQNARIRNAARQIALLVDSVTSYEISGRVRGEAKAPLALEVAESCRAIAQEVETVWGGGHRFAMSVGDGIGELPLDEVLFRRIVQNLLTNAFRYTPAGGKVELKLSREGDRLLLEVADDGIGIPEEEQPHIFEAFYRSSNVETRRGLGLGLSIVRDALDTLGGEIRVASSPGEGTVMLVEIPLVR